MRPCFFIKAWPYTPCLWSLIIPFETQKPLLWVMILPVWWIGSLIQQMHPSPLVYFCHVVGVHPCLSKDPTHHTITIPSSPSATEWYSFPKGCGLQGTHIHPGQYSLSYVFIDLSKHLWLLGEYSGHSGDSTTLTFSSLQRTYLNKEVATHLWNSAVALFPCTDSHSSIHPIKRGHLYLQWWVLKDISSKHPMKKVRPRQQTYFLRLSLLIVAAFIFGSITFYTKLIGDIIKNNCSSS